MEGKCGCGVITYDGGRNGLTIPETCPFCNKNIEVINGTE
jgi:hypothetical protein